MTFLSTRFTDLVGAITANLYNLLIISLFIARMAGNLQLARNIGIVSLFAIIPVVYLFVAAILAGRPAIYFIWVLLMAAFLIFELLIDYIFKVDFRHTTWSVILYVMFFSAATGGMIGVASQAGKPWAIATSLTFLAMLTMSFVQRAKTGL